MAYEALLTAQEVADFLGLERISILNLVRADHMRGVKVGSKTVVSLGELRRYLEEGPAPGLSGREDWRPLIEEFPGRRKRAEQETYREEVRKKYDAVFVQDLDEELDLDIDPWEIVERMERKGLLEMYRPPDYQGYSLLRRSDLATIRAYIEEEEARKAQRRAERAAQKKEPRIKL
jgi:excisionase family DNA binding protein